RPAGRRRSACGLRRHPRGLVRLLRGLVVGESLRGVDIPEGRMTRHEILGYSNVEALREHGSERLDLHLAEPGEGGDAAAEVGSVRGLGPDARGIATVFLRDGRGKLARAL